jgi:hypothetical protein
MNGKAIQDGLGSSSKTGMRENERSTRTIAYFYWSMPFQLVPQWSRQFAVAPVCAQTPCAAAVVCSRDLVRVVR